MHIYGTLYFSVKYIHTHIHKKFDSKYIEKNRYILMYYPRLPVTVIEIRNYYTATLLHTRTFLCIVCIFYLFCML